MCCFRIFSSHALSWNTTYVSIGVYSRLCTGFFFLTLCVQCVACMNGCVELVLLVLCLHVSYAVMCIVLLSVGIVWNCVC
jgi:hypothetical protein